MTKKEFDEFMKKINALKVEVRELREEIDRMNNEEILNINKPKLIQCCVCGKEVSNKAISCPHCGQSIADTEIVLEEFFDSFFIALSNYDKTMEDEKKVVFFSPGYESMNGFGVVISIDVISEIKGKFFLEAECDGKFYVEEEIDPNIHMQLKLEIEKMNYDECFEAQCISYKVGYLYGQNVKEVLFQGTTVFDWDDDGDIYVENEEVYSDLKQMPQKVFEESFGSEYWEYAINDDGESYETDIDEYEEDNEIYRSSNSNTNTTDYMLETSEWNEESYLRSQGYTVSQTEGLSDDERQNILYNVLNSNVMSKHDIIQHLERMINLRKTSARYVNAIEKWERDIYFLMNL